MEIIDFDRNMTIKNLEAMPRGTGAKYIEILVAHNGDFVFYKVRRTVPKEIPYDHKIIRFK